MQIEKDTIQMNNNTLASMETEDHEQQQEEQIVKKQTKLKLTSLNSRSIPLPPHRITPLKKDWESIYTPIVQQLGLQIRFNPSKKSVQLRSETETENMQKAAEFVRAYGLGFAVEDAIAILRLDNMYIDTFMVKDVKTLSGDNLSRAIGRIVGKDGKTKFTIENSSKTRIVVADSKIHILGSFQNIKIARDAVCALILGSSPGKVYTKLRSISARMKERF